MLKGELIPSGDDVDTFCFFSCGVPGFVPSRLFLFLGTTLSIVVELLIGPVVGEVIDFEGLLIDLLVMVPAVAVGVDCLGLFINPFVVEVIVVVCFEGLLINPFVVEVIDCLGLLTVVTFGCVGGGGANLAGTADTGVITKSVI